jgi:hypothetical protein
LVNPDMDSLCKSLEDVITLVDVLYVLVSDQADQAGVSDEDFGRTMRGDGVEAATNALLDEIVDFSPSRRRAILEPIIRRQREKEAEAVAAVEKSLPEILDKVFDSTPSEKPTDSEE